MIKKKLERNATRWIGAALLIFAVALSWPIQLHIVTIFMLLGYVTLILSEFLAPKSKLQAAAYSFLLLTLICELVEAINGQYYTFFYGITGYILLFLFPILACAAKIGTSLGIIKNQSMPAVFFIAWLITNAIFNFIVVPIDHFDFLSIVRRVNVGALALLVYNIGDSRRYQKALVHDGSIHPQSIALNIIFSLLSLGLNNIIWTAAVARSVRNLNQDPHGVFGETLCCCIIPFYNLYWAYTRANRLYEGAVKRDIKGFKNSGVLYLVLNFFGLGLITLALLQNDINRICCRLNPCLENPAIEKAPQTTL